MRRARDGAGYGEAVRSRGGGAPRPPRSSARSALLLRSVGTDHDRLAHTGAKPRTTTEIPAAALSVPDAEMLHRVLAEKKTRARALSVLGAHTLPDADSANVSARCRGATKPGEIVLLGAHLDSWDLGTGAIDDGAGVAIVLEAARLLAALPQQPRRTVRVVLFANEEHGLEGAKDVRARARRRGGRPRRRHRRPTSAPTASTRCAGSGIRRRARASRRSRACSRRSASSAQDDAGDGRRRRGAAAGARRPHPRSAPGRDALLRLPPHRERHARQDRPGVLARAAAAFATAAWAAAEMDGDFGRVPEGAAQGALGESGKLARAMKRTTLSPRRACSSLPRPRLRRAQVRRDARRGASSASAPRRGASRRASTPPPSARARPGREERRRLQAAPGDHRLRRTTPALEAEVRKKLGKDTGPITPADLAQIKSINLSTAKVAPDRPVRLPHVHRR